MHPDDPRPDQPGSDPPLSTDLDDLLRDVERLASRRDWDGLERLRRRARAAIERGHQLWPAATFAEYRLALEAPPQWAAAMVTDESGWMGPGPIAEVVAQHHTWAELADLLPTSARRPVVAQERVVRGESVPDADAGDLPGRLLAWEPGYALARYLPDGTIEVEEAAIALPRTGDEIVQLEGSVGDRAADLEADSDASEGARALRDAVAHWSTRSSGSVRSVGVAGGILDALGALGVDGARVRECGLADAAALLAWAAADGGANGRRRGAATGRHEAWWCLSVLAGVDDDWPLDPGPGAARLRYALWLPDAPVTGWSARLAVEDPDDGLAWALDAADTSTSPN